MGRERNQDLGSCGERVERETRRVVRRETRRVKWNQKVNGFGGGVGVGGGGGFCEGFVGFGVWGGGGCGSSSVMSAIVLGWEDCGGF